jgi:hypothetical protein
VVVVEAGNFVPVVKPALFRLNVANVFAPVMLTLSPVIVRLLKVLPPPANGFVEEPVSVILISDVPGLSVNPVVVDIVQAFAGPGPVIDTTLEPRVIVRVFELLELNTPQETALEFVFSVPKV